MSAWLIPLSAGIRTLPGCGALYLALALLVSGLVAVTLQPRESEGSILTWLLVLALVVLVAIAALGLV